MNLFIRDLIFIFNVLIASFRVGKSFYCTDPCVALSSIDSLTFRQNNYVSYTDGTVYPQLDCIEGNGCDQASQIKAVTCYNVGNDNEGYVKWSCEADIPNSVDFGYTDPVCEGYRTEYDEKYIYRGTCSLVFSLYYRHVWWRQLFYVIAFASVCYGCYRLYYLGYKGSSTEYPTTLIATPVSSSPSTTAVYQQDYNEMGHNRQK